MVSDDIEGQVTEYSESVMGILKPYGLQPESQSNNLSKRISDIVVDLNYAEIRNGRTTRYNTQEIYENMHVVDLMQFSEVISSQILLKIGLNINSLARNGDSSELLVNTKVRIFEERYSGGILDMNIFCFLILNDGEYANRASSVGNTLSSKNN